MSLINRMRRRNVAAAKVVRQHAPVDVGAECRMSPQSFEFRTEQQNVALPAVVQRLLAHAVARQRQDALLAVPQREGEHADGPFAALLRCPKRSKPANRISVSE